MQSGHGQPPRLLPRFDAVAWCWLVACLALASAAALVETQRRLATLHPACVPVLLLLALEFSAAAVGLGLIVWRARRGSGNRTRLACWAGALMLPILLTALPFARAGWQWANLQIPHDRLGHLVIVTAGGLMEGQAEYLYPRRLESDRLVMFYHELDRPEEDLASMTQHVANLETQIDAPLRAKIYWIRGTLLGQGNCSFLGLALGSTTSPADWTSAQGFLDQHELAHAVITQQRPVEDDPPTVLHEGWAESQAGWTSQQLAARVLEHQEHEPDLRVADLFAPSWYYSAQLPVYTFGGAFVDFLLRRYGTRRFVDLYNRCQTSTFESDILATYGRTLTELETDFWDDVRALAQDRTRR